MFLEEKMKATEKPCYIVNILILVYLYLLILYYTILYLLILVCYLLYLRVKEVAVIQAKHNIC